MPEVVGVVFKSGGKIYKFESGGLEFSRGDLAVVETARGLEVGEVAEVPHEVSVDSLAVSLKAVVRRAGSQDLEMLAANDALRDEALVTCREMIARHGLDMKLVDAEVLFGGGKIIFSFYAEERVDFRALVVDLAKALHMRIELRQIGVRDEARILGGLGPCGRHLCCTLFQVDQEPVSIRMAKEQNLPLNPMKISGLCGRLMCCLKYEQEQYVAFRKEAPRRGTPVHTPRGKGVVVGYQVPKDSLTIKYEDGSFFDEPMAECSLTERLCCADMERGEAQMDKIGRPVSEAAEEPSRADAASSEGEASTDVIAVPGDMAPAAGEDGGSAGAEAGGAAVGTPAGAEAAGAEERPSSSKKRRNRRRSSRSKKSSAEAEGTRGETGGEKSGADSSAAKERSEQKPSGSSAGGDADSSAKKRPRRRRRRPRSAQGDAQGGGPAGNAAGESGSGGGGAGGSGGGNVS